MVAVVNALWILGVELKSSIALDNGIEIVPIDEMPDSRQKNDFEKIEFNSLGCRQLKPKAAITIKSKVLKSSPCDTFEIPEKDMPFMESGRLLNDVSLLLNAVEGVSCHTILLRIIYATRYAIRNVCRRRWWLSQT